MWDLFQTRWNLFFRHKSTRNHLFNERSELNKWIRVDLWQNYRFHRVEKISHWRLNTMHDATFSHTCYILRCSSGVPQARCRRGGSRGAEPPLLRKLFKFFFPKKESPKALRSLRWLVVCVHFKIKPLFFLYMYFGQLFVYFKSYLKSWNLHKKQLFVYIN